ncbi:MAG TPA: SLC13 family permease [Tepidisphaeraceae bacterium]|nr:SLC13 family permease [Tepidisphaeraceae bacterium]
MPKVAKFFSMLIGTVLALFLLRVTGMLVFDARQITSITIFSMFIYGTLLFGDFRLAFAFGGIALLMGLNLLSVEGFTQSASLNVIIFLVGMFLVIGFLEENQFFESVVNGIIGWIGPRPKVLLVVLMLMGTISAALVDEVTSILFMTGTMLHLTTKHKLNPVPFVIMLVFATNIGSSASSIGNPIGVMIALKAGFSFLEFLRWSAPIAVVVNVVTYLICRWWFADSVKAFEDAIEVEHVALEARNARRTASLAAVGGGGDGGGLPLPEGDDPSNPLGNDFDQPGFAQAIDGLDDKQSRRVSWIVFLCTIVLLMTHGLTEHLLGIIMGAPGGHLPEGTMMVGASLAMGSVVLLLRGNKARELVERRVDWWTLSFFMMLFASVGTLKETQVTRVIAERLIHFCGEGHPGLLIQIVGWATGWLSAFLDNVLAVATFMPVVEDVRKSVAPAGYPESIYWLMLFGGTFMGNMTVIGSTANIIACGVLEKRGFGGIAFGYWFKIGFIVSIASMLVATLLLGLQTNWFQTPMLPPPH